MTCEDCLYYEFCSDQYGRTDYFDDEVIVNPIESMCNNFKDKSFMFEIPCKVGDKVYSLMRGKVETWIVKDIVVRIKSKSVELRCRNIADDYAVNFDYKYSKDYILFLTKADVRKALAAENKKGDVSHERKS